MYARSVRAQEILARFNATAADADDERRQLLTALFAKLGAGTVVKPTLRCGYGFDIAIGERSFVNFDCVLLDCHRITISSEVQIAPGVTIGENTVIGAGSVVVRDRRRTGWRCPTRAAWCARLPDA